MVGKAGLVVLPSKRFINTGARPVELVKGRGKANLQECVFLSWECTAACAREAACRSSSCSCTADTVTLPNRLPRVRYGDPTGTGWDACGEGGVGSAQSAPRSLPGRRHRGREAETSHRGRGPGTPCRKRISYTRRVQPLRGLQQTVRGRKFEEARSGVCLRCRRARSASASM